MRRFLRPAMEAHSDGSTLAGTLTLFRALFKQMFKEDPSSIAKRNVTLKELKQDIQSARQRLQEDIDVRELVGYVKLEELKHHLSIDGEIVRSQHELLKQLKRLQEVSEIREHKYFPNYIKYLEKLESVYGHGKSLLPGLYRAQKEILKVFEPLDIPELTRLLTQSESFSGKSSLLRTIKRSPSFLGDWYLSDGAASRFHVGFKFKETVVEVKKDYGVDPAMGGAHNCIKPKTKQECLEILDAVEPILESLSVIEKWEAQIEHSFTSFQDDFCDFYQEYYLYDGTPAYDGKVGSQLPQQMLDALAVLEIKSDSTYLHADDMIRLFEKHTLKVLKAALVVVDRSILRMH